MSISSALLGDLKKYFHHTNFRSKEQKEAVREDLALIVPSCPVDFYYQGSGCHSGTLDEDVQSTRL
jgi:hypothetical protein